MVLTYRRTHARIRYPSNKTSNAACQKKCGIDLKIVCACCSMGDKCTKYIFWFFYALLPLCSLLLTGSQKIETGVAVQELSGED